MDKKKKPTSTDVGKQINDTKREIAELSEELQRLINSNVSKSHNPTSETTKSLLDQNNPSISNAIDNKVTKTSNISITKNLNSSRVIPVTSVENVTAKLDSLCKKEKTYNKEVTKEYIKKQREKREEERKKTNSKTKIDQELKKQKLYELRQKSLALVQRNVQLKRERSKSRDNRDQIRIDRNVVNTRGSSLDRKTSSVTLVRKTSTLTKSAFPHKEKPKTFQQKYTKEESHEANNLLRPVESNVQCLKEQSLINKNVCRSRAPFRNASYLNAPFRKASHSSMEPSNSLSRVDKNLAAVKIQSLYRGYRQRKQLKSNLNTKSEHSIMTDACVKESKETQTNLLEPPKMPVWLQVPPIDPYPCNFINTIKRKLQFVINSPCNSKDVGIQSSLISPPNINIDNKNRKENEHQTPKSYGKSDMRSFLSHRISNLDADALQHLALVHRENKSDKNLKEKVKSDSESDTSKNIPEISSESGSTSNRYLKPASGSQNNSYFLHINTERIRNLRLRNQMDRKEKLSDISHKSSLETRKESGDLDKSMSKKSYTFNFYDDIKTESSERTAKVQLFDTSKRDKYINSSRGSIISGNKSDYDILPDSASITDIHTVSPSQNEIKSEKSPVTSGCQEEKFIKSPRDSIISFNRSDYSNSPHSISFQNNPIPSDSISNDEIQTEKSVTSMSIANKHSERVNSSVSNEQSQRLAKSKSVNIPISLKSKENDRTSISDLIKDIENSMNTSLISHMSVSQSGQSDSSHISGHHPKPKSIPSSNSQHSVKVKHKSSQNERSKSPSLIKKDENILREVSENIPKKSSNTASSTTIPSFATFDIPNNLPSSKCNELNLVVPGTHISTQNEIEAPKSHSEKIETILNSLKSSNEFKALNSGKSTDELNTELSSQTTNDSRYNSMAKTAEFVSLYSSNFSSEKSDADSTKSNTINRKSEGDFSTKPQECLASSEDQLKNNNSANEIGNNTQTVKNISNAVFKSKADMNEIHLKFEAEVHLLNDFNESLKQFMAVEKAFETIKNKNEVSNSKLHDSSSQSSKNSSALFPEEGKISANLSKSIISSINISRGTDSNFSRDSLLRKHWKNLNDSKGREISNMEVSVDHETSVSLNESQPNSLAGLSVKMFEQLIRDEDVRIENLKTILKIREQALLDRTKGELAWLEIQRKHLKETGKIHEASLVKKKQRGILLKHQQESREMQRLKQLQKIKSNERKTKLKEQRNLIKAKLMSEKMSDFKVHTPRKEKSTGPMKVLQSSESVHSETSISKKASDGEEIFSFTSRSRSIRLSEVESSRELIMNKGETDIKLSGSSQNLSIVNKALLMRQAALLKRRKAVEDLLRRHQKLLEEEKKIEELEMAANALIMQMPTITQSKPSSATKLKVKGQHLNDLGQKMGAFAEKKFSDNKTYSLSQSSYDKLHVEAGSYRLKHKKSQLAIQKSLSENAINDISSSSDFVSKSNKNDQVESRVSSELSSKVKTDYSDDFELDTQEVESDPVMMSDADVNNISSISGLIQDFSKIEHGISMLSQQFDSVPSTAESNKSITSSDNISESLKESVIETNKSSPQTIRTINTSVSVAEGSEIQTANLTSEKPTSRIIESSQNETLESLKDEDISAVIQGMLPSSTSSEISLNDCEQEEAKSLSKLVFNEIIEASSKAEEIPSEQVPKFRISEEKSLPKSELSGESTKAEEITSERGSTSNKSHISGVQSEELNTDFTTNESSEPIEEKIQELLFSVQDSVPTLIDSDTSKDEKIEKKSSGSIPNVISLNESTVSSEEELRKNVVPLEEVSKSNHISSEMVIERTDIPTSPSDKEVGENEINDASISTEGTRELSPGKIENHELDSENKLSNIERSENKTSSVVETIEEDSDSGLEGKLDENISLHPGSTLPTSKSEVIDLDGTISPVQVSSEKIERVTDENVIPLTNNISSQTLMSSEDLTKTDSAPKVVTIEEELKRTDSNSNNEEDDVIENPIENVPKLETTMITFENEENSTDISEKIFTDSDQLQIELSQSESSSDDYTDDFEDDKDEESSSKDQLNELSNETPRFPSSTNQSTSSTSGRTQNRKSELEKTNIVMVQIDLTVDEELKSDNKATITVMKKEPICEAIVIENENDISESVDVVLKVNNQLLENFKENELEGGEVKDEEQISETIEDREVDESKPQEVNVKKRISEIMANTVDSPRTSKEKSVRYQDYYVTTYDDISPAHSPESVSPSKSAQLAPMAIFGNEAEELLKKQLAIEQEIKHLEQQQKEQLPFVYMREIPNKPPPPYTPPSSLTTSTILPSKVEDLNEICNYSAKVLYNAYLSNNLTAVKFSETQFRSINQTKSTKECCLFVFDLCKEVAKNHYKQFEKDNVPCWLKLPEESRLVLGKPFDYHQLEKHINTKLKELLGFEKPSIKENAIIKWSRKKKDHVDEILVLESQMEEHQWLNYDKDELMVINDVTNEIFDMLLSETVGVFRKIFS